MADIRELESQYTKEIPRGNKVTHITTLETWRQIQQTSFPGDSLPTILAVRQSRTTSSSKGVNVACNLGPLIYTFNYPAEYFFNTEEGRLTLEGIQEKAGKDAVLVSIEWDEDVVGEIEEIPRFLPLSIEVANGIIELLNKSNLGKSLATVFLDTILNISQLELNHLNRKIEINKLYRSILTSIAYSVGGLTNFAMYGPRIAKHLFMDRRSRNIRIAGHGFISGKIPEEVLLSPEEASKHFKQVLISLEKLEGIVATKEVDLLEVYESLGVFFDPECHGLKLQTLEMFLDLDNDSFYYLLKLLREYNKFNNIDIENISLYIHSIYHYLLVSKIYERHIENGNLGTKIFRTFEPNAGHENFIMISPGSNDLRDAKIYKNGGNGGFVLLSEQPIRLSHDYPTPVSSHTTPGLAELGIGEVFKDMQIELEKRGLLVPAKRL